MDRSIHKSFAQPIHLWMGFHSLELRDLIQECWVRDELLIVCPPQQSEFSFLKLIPHSSLHLHGDWTEERRQEVSRQILETASTRATAPEFPARAVLGVFTSGTVNGSPRLILYSKKNLESSLSAIRSLFEVDRLRTIFCYPQPFHTFGLVLGYLQSVLYDMDLVVLQGKYSKASHAAWLTFKSNQAMTLGTPTHFKDLIAEVRLSGAIPRETYSAIIGGAKTEVELWETVKSELKIQAPSIGYGATEASPGIMHLSPGLRPKELGEIGNLLEGVRIDLEPEKGLWFEGDNVCLAIIQGNEVSFPKRILIRDEIVRRESDGRWVYKGRTDLVINRGGAKLSLEWLEDLMRVATGKQVVCVGVEDPRLGQDLGVLMACKKQDDFEDAIMRLVFEKTGIRPNPNYCMKVKDIPLNASMKVDRRESANILKRRLHEEGLVFDPS